MKSTGGRLGRQEKAKKRNRWDWMKSKMERDILLLHWWVDNNSHLQHIGGIRGRR